MTPYFKASLVVLGALLVSFGTALAAASTPVNWVAVGAAVCTSVGSAIMGLLTDMRFQWTDEKRAAKTGETDEKA